MIIKATYSLWRDESDYHIEWNQDAFTIKRFVDAIGYPYEGALLNVEGIEARVYGVELKNDVHIENRRAGKVIFMENGFPVVACNNGLLKTTYLKDKKTG